MLIQHDHLDLKDPDCPSCEVDRMKATMDRYREERNRLIRTCVTLAAPLSMGTDGTPESAEFHITTYVQFLEDALRDLRLDAEIKNVLTEEPRDAEG